MSQDRKLSVGDRVRLIAVPPDFETMPEETQQVFRLSPGRVFRIEGFGPYGHAELEVGSEIDAIVGGFMNSIWVEHECLEWVSSVEGALEGSS